MFRKDTNNSSLILEIQQEAIAKDCNISSLLRKAKVAATKLKQKDAVLWITNELDGYTCDYDELPNYRRTHGVLKLKNPYHGLIPYIIQDERTEELLTRTPFTDGIGTLEKLLVGQEKGQMLHYKMAPIARNFILESLEAPMEPILLVSYSQIETILNRVTSLVLDWALELESRGILGEGMSFSPQDTKRASEATQTIIAQNIGNIGNTSGSSRTDVKIESSGKQQIDQRQLSHLVNQARQASDLLPDDLRNGTRSLLDEIDQAKSEDEKRKKLLSLRNILEGATGNVAAQGIIQLIASIL